MASAGDDSGRGATGSRTVESKSQAKCGAETPPGFGRRCPIRPGAASDSRAGGVWLGVNIVAAGKRIPFVEDLAGAVAWSERIA